MLAFSITFFYQKSNLLCFWFKYPSGSFLLQASHACERMIVLLLLYSFFDYFLVNDRGKFMPIEGVLLMKTLLA